MGVFILFDIGGTNTRIAVSSDGKKIDKVKTIPTSREFEEGMKAIERIVNELAAGRPVEKVSGGIAGMLNADKQSLYYSPNLLGWVGKPLGERVGRAAGAPIIIENDCALAGLGEAVLGAGTGFHSVMYMTVSTGVGGARIINGKIDERVYGFEPGQQIIDINHGACPDCKVAENRINGMGYLEDYISGKSVERRFGKRAEDFPQDHKLWEELADWLAIGLYNSILHWSPEAIILGGSLILVDPVIQLERVEIKLKEMFNIFPEIPVIKKATLGNNSVLYGALWLSQNN